MTSTIGIRVYRVTVNESGKALPLLPLDSKDLNATVQSIIAKFVAQHSSVTQNDAAERSWYFEEKVSSAGRSKGYLHYGTYGFESKLVDNRTKKENYKRKVHDIEEIPLFYEFWCPPKSTSGLFAFQSFQGRSCISMVMSALRDLFDKKNPRHYFGYSKLSPNDLKNNAFLQAPVKELRLIKRSAPSDIADQYFPNRPPAPVDLEVIISARRKSSLGRLGELVGKFQGGQDSLIEHNGVEFPEAFAEVRVGNKTRRVGLYGVNSDAGVIDITHEIKRGSDGHPTFESLEEEVNSILTNFSKTLAERKR